MHRLILLYCFALLSNLSASAQLTNWKDKVAPELQAAFNRGETADFMVIMREQADVSGANNLPTKFAKAHFVYARLEETAGRSQANARRILRENNANSNSLRLVNAIAVEKAGASVARQLAELPEVAAIESDPWIKFDGPIAQQVADPGVKPRNQVEWGVARINAPDVWALGYTGQGITVGGADTGYDWTHPAIQPKYRGWTGDAATSDHNYNWHDAIHDYSPLNYDTAGNPGTNPCGLNIQAPCDDNSHGTHTMGTMTGDDGNGNMIGVAPGAKWIGCRNMERGWGKPSSYIECFEWFMAPTDVNNLNPNPDKAPHVINNSWYCAVMEGCTDHAINNMLKLAVINLKASGVVVVVSNGNNGPSCASTDGPPAYFEESFSVGATRDDEWIASFSSRGPVLIDTSYRMKPNVSAPGQNVRSSVPNNGYANYSGTSMAGPHVVGLVALVLSAQPALAGHVSEIENIVEQTTVFHADTIDCGSTSPGSARPNHAFGWGRVDALAAVQKALQWVPSATVIPVSPAARVYPNPVHDVVFFDLEHVTGPCTITIFSAEGAVVATRTIYPAGWALEQVSMQNLPSGMYFYKISTGNGMLNGKILRD
jgi:subtilisin family serine protease